MHADHDADARRRAWRWTEEFASPRLTSLGFVVGFVPEETTMAPALHHDRIAPLRYAAAYTGAYACVLGG